MTTIIFGILEEGLVYAIMALGVYITYKILDFPDLSVDGTFPLGAAVTAAGIANGLPFIGTISPVAALFISFAVGALAGCIPGIPYRPAGGSQPYHAPPQRPVPRSCPSVANRV